MALWYHRVLIYSLIIGSTSSSSSSSSNHQGSIPRRSGNGNNSGASFSPIRELGPSLAASVAGGTVVAARSAPRPSSYPGNAVDGGNEVCDEDCLVVLFRSPISSESRSGSGITKRRNDGDAGTNLTVASVFGHRHRTDDGNCANSVNPRNDNHRGGLTFLPNGPVGLPFLPGGGNLRVLHAPSGLLAAATGFAPDADHVLDVAAGRVFSRISVFDAPSASSSAGGKSVDPHRLVREDLSSMMIDAAMSDGGRPLGVQLLVIGQSSLSRGKKNGCSLEIYTVDPSGGWRSCVGRGTAVGRGAERVNSSFLRPSPDVDVLEDASTKGTDTPYRWRGALDRAMMAAIDGLEKDRQSNNEADARSEDAAAKYGAVVVFGGSRGPRGRTGASICAAIDPFIVEERYEVCQRRVASQKLAKQ